MTSLALVHDGSAPALSLDDLREEGGEPRVPDRVVAQRLGYERPADIRELIERNAAELATYGEVIRTARKTPEGGRPGREFWLNEGQALVICALSRTAQAAAVRRQIIEVFMAWRRGELPAQSSAAPALESSALARLVDEVSELRERMIVAGAVSSDLLYGAPAIAAFLNVRQRQAYHLIDAAGLPTFKLAGKVCGRRSSILAWLGEREHIAFAPPRNRRQGGRADG